MAPRLFGLVGSSVEVRSIARPRRSSPAVGSALRHAAEQASLIAGAFEGVDAPKSGRTGRTPVATRE
jgi:hypothetical protein